jgi:hypothetical protein
VKLDSSSSFSSLLIESFCLGVLNGIPPTGCWSNSIVRLTSQSSWSAQAAKCCAQAPMDRRLPCYLLNSFFEDIPSCETRRGKGNGVTVHWVNTWFQFFRCFLLSSMHGSTSAFPNIRRLHTKLIVIILTTNQTLLATTSFQHLGTQPLYCVRTRWLSFVWRPPPLRREKSLLPSGLLHKSSPVVVI